MSWNATYGRAIAALEALDSRRARERAPRASAARDAVLLAHEGWGQRATAFALGDVTAMLAVGDKIRFVDRNATAHTVSSVEYYPSLSGLFAAALRNVTARRGCAAARQPIGVTALGVDLAHGGASLRTKRQEWTTAYVGEYRDVAPRLPAA